MLSLLNKKPSGQTITFKLSGMHCSSCAMNIDGALEDTHGVIESKANYAGSKVQITYNPDQIKPSALQKIISDLGYTATEQ